MISWMTLFALVAIAAWVPVLWRFFSAWRKRRNPVSLAICLMITLLLYTSIISIMRLDGTITPEWAWFGFLLFNVTTCANFYAAFWWSGRKFTDTRDSGGRG